MWPLTEDTGGGGKGAFFAKTECGTVLKGSRALREELATSRSEDDVFSNVGECWHSSIAEVKLHKLLCPCCSPTDIHPAHTVLSTPLGPFISQQCEKRGPYVRNSLCCRLPAGASCFLPTGTICVFYNQSLAFWGCSHMVRVRLQGISMYFKKGKGRISLNWKHLILTTFSVIIEHGGWTERYIRPHDDSPSVAIIQYSDDSENALRLPSCELPSLLEFFSCQVQGWWGRTLLPFLL